MEYQMVTWPMMSRYPKRYILTHISQKRLETEVRFQWITNREWPMANRLVTWSMTPRDLERPRSCPKMVWAYYLENDWRYRLGYNRAPIGNGTRDIKWSLDRWHHVTLKGQGRDPDIFTCKMYRKQLEIEAGFQWTTNGKWDMANRMVTWSMTSRDLITVKIVIARFTRNIFFEDWHLTIQVAQMQQRSLG